MHTHKTPIVQLCIFACKYWAHFYPVKHAQYTDQQLTEMRDRQAYLQSLEGNSPT